MKLKKLLLAVGLVALTSSALAFAADVKLFSSPKDFRSALSATTGSYAVAKWGSPASSNVFNDKILQQLAARSEVTIRAVELEDALPRIQETYGAENLTYAYIPQSVPPAAMADEADEWDVNAILSEQGWLTMDKKAELVSVLKNLDAPAIPSSTVNFLYEYLPNTATRLGADNSFQSVNDLIGALAAVKRQDPVRYGNTLEAVSGSPNTVVVFGMPLGNGEVKLKLMKVVKLSKETFHSLDVTVAKEVDRRKAQLKIKR
ncbi:MAG: hypothetical protein K0S08_1439 [Gammaproteobacteria bacterium]|jgi:hypothetical protein|nr:hypothetical protein [Gammaproteobacteria bacterium]